MPRPRGVARRAADSGLLDRDEIGTARHPHHALVQPGLDDTGHQRCQRQRGGRFHRQPADRATGGTGQHGSQRWARAARPRRSGGRSAMRWHRCAAHQGRAVPKRRLCHHGLRAGIDRAGASADDSVGLAQLALAQAFMQALGAPLETGQRGAMTSCTARLLREANPQVGAIPVPWTSSSDDSEAVRTSVKLACNANTAGNQNGADSAAHGREPARVSCRKAPPSLPTTRYMRWVASVSRGLASKPGGRFGTATG